MSEKEKIKAEEYYQAALKYPVMTGFNLINPFSGYRSNVLEKEARKASRSKTGKILKTRQYSTDYKTGAKKLEKEIINI